MWLEQNWSRLDVLGHVLARRVLWRVLVGDRRWLVDSIDYLSLAKADDTWRAVNILWQDDRSHGDDLIGEADAAGWVL